MEFQHFSDIINDFFQVDTKCINCYQYDTRFVSYITDFDNSLYRIEFQSDLPVCERWKIAEYWNSSLKAKYVGYGDKLGSAVNNMIDHYKKGIFAYDSP